MTRGLLKRPRSWPISTGQMSLRALPALGLTLAVGLIAPASAAAAPSSSLLFVQQASSGTLNRTAKGTYRLTLRDVAPSVASFTDRPSRKAASESSSAFVSKWAGRGFTKDPPNAALVLDGEPKTRDLAMVTLSRPRYDAKTRTFTYVARPLRGTPSSGLNDFTARRDPLRELRFGAASLFIDNASGTVFQPVTLQVINAAPGQTISVRLSALLPGSVVWSSGPSFSNFSGVQVTSQSGSLPLVNFNVASGLLTIQTSPDGGGWGVMSFTVQLYLAATGDLDAFYLSSTSDPGIQVTAAIGTAVPQVVNPAQTLFPWQPT